MSTDTRLAGGVLGSVLHDLVDRGVVARENIDQPGVRGPKSRYRLEESFGRVLAVGFGHDRLGVAVTDLSRTMLDGGDHTSSGGSPGWVDEGPTEAMAQAAQLASEALRQTGTLDVTRLVGIGISISAPLMEDGRPYKGFIDKWQPRDISDELQSQLGLAKPLPVVLENDANLIALREHHRGAARGAAHACVVRWGSGLGAGLIIDGAIYAGPRGLAGEIGHVATTAAVPDPGPDETLDLLAASPPRPACAGCGQPCLEALISSEGMLRYLAKRGRPQPNIAAAITAAHNGDEVVRNAVRGAAHLLGSQAWPDRVGSES